MSKEKSPVQKKKSSLKHDHRNVYGDNAKSSRKNIPLGKQRSHQAERRDVAQTLDLLGQKPDEDAMMAVENAAKVKSRIQQRKAFKKVPDAPLQQVLETKQALKNLDKHGRLK